MKIDTLLREARAKLGNKFSAVLDARLLLQAATGLTHADIAANPERDLNGDALAKFNVFVERRLAHEPVSRILGWREFYGRRFTVTPDVLDPRPDTEVVVEEALERMTAGKFLDLGTGSGAIAVTLCTENKSLSGVATDVSPRALAVAKTNALELGVQDRLNFVNSNWFAEINERFELIISNPPYIRAGTTLMADVAKYDPGLALFGGRDGLDAYRAISAGAPKYLKANGLVIVEIGWDQAEDVTQIFELRGFSRQIARPDLGGHVRALGFTYSQN